MRVVIAEDEVLLREGLQLVLSSRGFDVVAAVGDAVEVIVTVDELRPDLLITDIRMPPHHQDDGLRAAMALRNRYPEMAIVVLSQHVERQYALELLANGASRVGYLLKQRIADIGRFTADLHDLCAGGTVLDPEVVSAMIAQVNGSRRALDRLTERQAQVLALVAEGRSNAAIASRLVISEKAVVQHVSNIYDALGIVQHDDGHRRVLAVLTYLAGCSGSA